MSCVFAFPYCLFEPTLIMTRCAWTNYKLLFTLGRHFKSCQSAETVVWLVPVTPPMIDLRGLCLRVVRYYNFQSFDTMVNGKKHAGIVLVWFLSTLHFFGSIHLVDLIWLSSKLVSLPLCRIFDNQAIVTLWGSRMNNWSTVLCRCVTNGLAIKY